MPRRKVQKERQIESDDELSASGPEMSSDDAMSEDELNEHEVMRVQVWINILSFFTICFKVMRNRKQIV